MMCGRYAIFTKEENEEIRQIINELNERYKKDSTVSELKTGEIFPTDTAPAITADSKGARNISLFRWGFPGFNSNSSVIINARSETIYEKPTFKKLVYTNRCILPASAFYEWKKVDTKTSSKKQKYIIHQEGQTMFYMAGLYNTFIAKDSKPFNAFVIVTKQSNKEMSEIHERMPVIIKKGEENLWLSNYSMDMKTLNPLIMTYATPLVIKKVGA